MSRSLRGAAPTRPLIITVALAAAVGLTAWLFARRPDPHLAEARILERNAGAHEAHRQGELAVARGDQPDAIRGFETAARLEANSALARLNLALAHAQAGNTKASIVAAKAALALRPKWAEAWTKLAHFQADDGNLPDAKQAASRATTLDPGDPEGWLAGSRVALLQSDLKLAEGCARSALKRGNRLPAAWLALGDVLLRKPGNAGLNEALEAFARAVELDRTGYTLQRLGEVERRAGKPEQAAAHLREAVKLAPQDAAAAFQLAQVLTQLKDPEAQSWTERARELQERRYALTSLQRRAAQNPGDARLQTQLAKELERSGDRDGAVRALKTAYSLDPENEEIRRALVRLETGGTP